MKRMRLLMFGFLSIVSASALHAAETRVASGKLLSFGGQGTISIKAPTGGTRTPARGAIFYHRDELVLSGSMVACVASGTEPRGKCYPTGKWKILAGNDEEHRPGALRILTEWLNRPTQASTVAARSRGDEDEEEGQTLRGEAHRLMPMNASQRRQLMPPGYTTLRPLWLGGSPRITITDGSQVATISGANGWTLPSPLRRAAQLNIAFGSSAPLSWRIDLSTEIPVPPGLSANGSVLTNADRVDRAAWLLKFGPTEWHLFAISELQQLASANVYEAQLLLEMLLSDACLRPSANDCPV